MTRPRLAAILVLAALTLAATALSVIANFPRGLILAALLVGAGVAGRHRRRSHRDRRRAPRAVVAR